MDKLREIFRGLSDYDEISAIKTHFLHAHYALWGALMVTIFIYFTVTDTQQTQYITTFTPEPFISLPDIGLCACVDYFEDTNTPSIQITEAVGERYPDNTVFYPVEKGYSVCGDVLSGGINCSCMEFPKGSVKIAEENRFFMSVLWESSAAVPVIYLLVEGTDCFPYSANARVLAMLSKSYFVNENGNETIWTYELGGMVVTDVTSGIFQFNLQIPSLVIETTAAETKPALARRIITDTFSLFSLIGAGTLVLFAIIVPRIYFGKNKEATIDQDIREGVLHLTNPKVPLKKEQKYFQESNGGSTDNTAKM